MDFATWLKFFTDAEVFEQESMANHTGYGVGGNADYFVTVTSLRDFREVIFASNYYKVPYKIVGNGTNLVFCDNGFHGAVINTKKLNHYCVGDGVVDCSCGVNLKDLINVLAKKNNYLFAPLCGIPASIGGAVSMNASAFDFSIGQTVLSVDILKDDKKVTLLNEDCGFRYRGSKLLDQKEIITSVRFKIDGIKSENNSLEYFESKRGQAQPKGRSCGCVFKNPKGNFAGKLIEDAGLKGLTVGEAQVSVKHGNFIVVKNGAKAQDIYNLTILIKEKVKEKFGIELENEIEFVGDF